MEAVPQYTPLDYGIMAVVLIVVYKVIDFAKAVLLKRTGIRDDHAPKLMSMPCQVDPQHLIRSKEVHDMVKDIRDSQVRTDSRITGGQFDCPWNGRDEIRDLMETLRMLVTETRALTEELKRNRNGGTL